MPFGIPHNMVKDDLNKKSKNKIYKVSVRRKYVPNWQYHLQIIILYENPLEYLAKFI